MNNCRTIVFSNQKGGVSKTTDCLNVAYSLANTYKKSVLLLDLDSQASLSLDVGLDSSEDDKLNTIDELLGAYVDRDIKEFTPEIVKEFIYTPTYFSRVRENGKWINKDVPFGFDVIPSSVDLAVVGMNMARKAYENSEGKIYLYYIYDLVECIKNFFSYDYILVDTPPALDSISTNALAAANGICIPSNLDLMSFRGIRTFKETADFVQSSCQNRGLDHRGILGILLSLYAERRSVDRALEQYVHEFYPTPTFTHQIRESSDARRAIASGVLFSQINKKAKEDFDAIAEEIMFALDNPEGWKKRADETWNKILKEREGKK